MMEDAPGKLNSTGTHMPLTSRVQAMLGGWGISMSFIGMAFSIM